MLQAGVMAGRALLCALLGRAGLRCRDSGDGHFALCACRQLGTACSPGCFAAAGLACPAAVRPAAWCICSAEQPGCARLAVVGLP